MPVREKIAFYAVFGGSPYVLKNIEDFGTYWYDDPETHTNGEFDCVIKRAGDLYDFFECKYYKKSMSKKECRDEKEQL